MSGLEPSVELKRKSGKVGREFFSPKNSRLSEPELRSSLMRKQAGFTTHFCQVAKLVHPKKLTSIT
ncbi:MAG: hypothetical protein P1P64_06930 [Treponemataceae bacterium]